VAAELAARTAPGDADDDTAGAPAAIVELCARPGPRVRPTPAARQVASIFLPRAPGAAPPPGKPPGKPAGKPPGKPAGKPPGKPAGKPAGEPLREVTVLDRRDGRFYYVRADGTREPRDGAGQG